MSLTEGEVLVASGAAVGNKQQTASLSGAAAVLAELTKDTGKITSAVAIEVANILLKNVSLPVHIAGQLALDPSSLTVVADTLVAGVRVQIGQETMYLVYNDTNDTILNGKACYASGVDATNNLLKIDLADNSSFATSASLLGLATSDIPKQTMGLVTWFGQTRDFNTDSLTLGGLVYLGTGGDLTTTKPLYPAARILMGSVIKKHASEGIVQVTVNIIPRVPISGNYNFTSQGIGAGTFWKSGFYEWSTTDANLDEGSPTIEYGTAGAAKAAYMGIVAADVGVVVGGGQVGLRVNEIQDSEEGIQVAAQTAIITDDITSLSTDQYLESSEKFSGTVEYELYVVSGTPTAYSLDFNYGFFKYDDFENRDYTITGFEVT